MFIARQIDNTWSDNIPALLPVTQFPPASNTGNYPKSKHTKVGVCILSYLISIIIFLYGAHNSVKDKYTENAMMLSET